MPGRKPNPLIQVGSVFGRLIIIEVFKENRKTKVKCACECGTEVTCLATKLVSKISVKSCGCLQREAIAKVGRSKRKFSYDPGSRFGRLLILKRQPGKKPIVCQCDCGNVIACRTDGLARGDYRSCGCYHKDQSSKRISKWNAESAKYEGYSEKQPRTFDVWKGMIRRCHDPRHLTYQKYGAKGIKVCEFLREHPKHLEKLIGLRPEGDMSVDRFPDEKGNYSCGKCKECKKEKWKFNIRWASRIEQNNNRVNNVKYTLNGKTMNQAQWARHLGISVTCLCSRLERGWTLERALTTGKYNRPAPV